MNKLFKHTKKFMLLVTTVVMMLATSMVVLGAVSTTPEDAKDDALTVLKVGTHSTDKKTGEYLYDKDGAMKLGTVKAEIYENGYTVDGDAQFEVDLTGKEEGAELVQLKNYIKVDVNALVKYDSNDDGKADTYVNGQFTAKSSDESIAKVSAPKTETKDGKKTQYVIITAVGEKTGSATIKFTEKNPENPKKPKTATVKVTVKSLVEEINFDDNVVSVVDGKQVVQVGNKKGTVDLKTTINANASKKNIKYVVDKAYSKYISVSGKGVVTGKMNTDTLPGGYAVVRVVAQDQTYEYDVTAKNGKVSTKKATWGTNEVIYVKVCDPEVVSVKINNIAQTVDKNGISAADKYSAPTNKSAKQSYVTLDLKTNASSKDHTFKLQATAYSGSKWTGDVKYNALTYTTSNAKVATVDNNGLITAHANGSAKITVVPKDGVKLAGVDVFTINVKVTTDVETITVPGTEITAFTGANYTLKANVNNGVDAKSKKLVYSIKEAYTDTDPSTWVIKGTAYPTYQAYVEALSGKGLATGKIRSDVEGTVVYVVTSAVNESVTKEVTIHFIDKVTKITATVPSYDANGVKNDKNSTVLFLDRTPVEGQASVDDSCEVTLAVTRKKGTEPTSSLKGIDYSSDKPAIADVTEENGKLVIKAYSKGTAKITLLATDGSKQKATITVKVQQKVNAITVDNSGDGEIYVVLNGKKKDTDKYNQKTTAKFTASHNADADTKGVTYSFANNTIKGVTDVTGAAITFKGQNLTVNDVATTELSDAVKATADKRLLVGTLYVTAKDGTKEVVTDPAFKHVAKVETVKVYAVTEHTYVDQIEGGLQAIVDAATGGQGLTLTKGQKVNMATALKIPARVTARTLKWEVKDKADKAFVGVDAKGNVSAKKVTNLGEGATVTVSMPGSAGTVEATFNVRVIAADKDYSKELNTQIANVLKDNNLTWLGATPKYNAGKGILTLTISDINMSKEVADAEMREKLTNVVKVFKSAAEIAVYDTATGYKELTITDPYTKMEWSLERVGADVVVSENKAVIGTYGFTDVDVAIDALVNLITTDIDDIVEWGNKKLSVELKAENTAKGYAPYIYTTNYTVEVTVKDADVENFLDMKIGNIVKEFNDANKDEKKAETGIEFVTYDTASNSTIVSIFNGNVVIADAYALVKEDAVVALEDIFVNAATATVEVVTPEAKYQEPFKRNENSDVNNLVDRLYEKLCTELSEGATLRELEGTSVYATVDFDFSGKTYTKTYAVSFMRTMEAIDADVDAQIVAKLEKGNEFASITYVSEENAAIVAIKDFDATLAKAVDAVNEIEVLLSEITSAAYADTAQVGTTEDGKFVNLYYGEQISATDVLYAVKPEWKTDENILSRRLAELVGTKTDIAVNYIANTTERLALTYSVTFVVDLDSVEANIDAVVAEKVNAIDAAEVTLESVVLDASFSVASNTAVVVLNDAYLENEPEIVQGTGLYTMLVDTLNTAKNNCATQVVVTRGEVSLSLPLAEEIDAMFVIDMMKALGINHVEDLTAAPIELTLEFVSGEELTYVVEFVAESIEGKVVEAPFFLEIYEIPGSAEVTVPAEEVRYYQSYAIGGTILTIEEANDCVAIFNGKEYEPVDGVITVTLPMVMGRQSLVVGVKNNSVTEATYELSFEYPLGSQMRPEEMKWLSDAETEYSGSVEANSYTGYNYTYTAENDGFLNFSFAEVTEGVTADVSVYNINSYAQESLSEGTADVLSVPVSKGDELQIQVVAMPVVNVEDRTTEYPAMDYTLVVSYTLPEFLEIEELPATVYVNVPAGETVFYQSYMIGGTVLTVKDATGNAVVLYDGTRYKAEEGKVEITLPQVRFQSLGFGIKNNGETNEVYEVSFAYPVGSQMNPENLESVESAYCMATIEEGNAQGYYYTYTAPADGTVSFWFDYATDGVEGDIIVNNVNSYKNRTLMADGVENFDYGYTAVEMPVSEGDELQITVNVLPDENWKYPAMEYGMVVKFAYPAGTELNPIQLTTDSLEDEFAAGSEVYYTGRFAGMTLTVTGANAYIIHNDAKVEAVDGVASVVLTGDFWNAPVFVIGNAGTEAATYSITIKEPAGTWTNPEEITVGTYSKAFAEGAEAYYYQFTVATDGTMTFDISATTENGWEYTINGLKADGTPVYGDKQWSDSEPVKATATYEVKAGDVYTIIVRAYDNETESEFIAGTVNFTLSYTAAE